MATTYARMVDGRAVEIFAPLFDGAGDEVPIEKRFHPDFVATLTVYDPANPPAPPAPPLPTADEVRAQRDAMLSRCDWTQLPDVGSASRSKWATYRQALRDLPAQDGFPAAVKWPQAPA